MDVVWIPLLCGFVAWMSFAVYLGLELGRAAPPAKERPSSTMLDVHTAKGAVRLVACLCVSDTTTSFDLASQLLRLYGRFPPSEKNMQALSLEQQRLCGTGGAEEFAVTTVYFAMMMAISTVVHSDGDQPFVRKTRLRRVASEQVCVLPPSLVSRRA